MRKWPGRVVGAAVVQESMASITNPGVWAATRQSSLARQTHDRRRCAARLNTVSPATADASPPHFALAVMSRTDDKGGFRAGSSAAMTTGDEGRALWVAQTLQAHGASIEAVPVSSVAPFLRAAPGPQVTRGAASRALRFGKGPHRDGSVPLILTATTVMLAPVRA